MNNEPAFPQTITPAGNPVDCEFASAGGLTKREYFAAQALPFALQMAFANLAAHLPEVSVACLSNDDAQDAVFQCARDTAYAIADKMLSTEAAHDER